MRSSRVRVRTGAMAKARVRAAARAIGRARYTGVVEEENIRQKQVTRPSGSGLNQIRVPSLLLAIRDYISARTSATQRESESGGTLNGDTQPVTCTHTWLVPKGHV